MSEIRITPGGNVTDISANSVYSIPSQVSGGKMMRPFDVRSGVEPITRAVVYVSGADPSAGIQQMSALSAATNNANGGSAVENQTFSANGKIGAAGPYSIRVGSATNITSVMELYVQYQSPGEARRKL